MSAAVKNLKIILLFVVLLAAGASASSCASGEWAFLGECQGCGGDMTSPANSESQDACTCNPGYVMTEATRDDLKCDFCGDGRVAPVSTYASTLTRDSCKCNAGYAGYDGSEFYFGQVPPCEPCPAGTFKNEISSVTQATWDSWKPGCDQSAWSAHLLANSCTYNNIPCSYLESVFGAPAIASWSDVSKACPADKCPASATDSLTCEYSGRKCAEILGWNPDTSSGGWGYAASDVCGSAPQATCTNFNGTAGYASVACPTTCANIEAVPEADIIDSPTCTFNRNTCADLLKTDGWDGTSGSDICSFQRDDFGKLIGFGGVCNNVEDSRTPAVLACLRTCTMIIDNGNDEEEPEILVLVKITLSLPMSKVDFTADKQVAFKASLARAAGSSVDNNHVTIDKIEKIEYGYGSGGGSGSSSGSGSSRGGSGGGGDSESDTVRRLLGNALTTSITTFRSHRALGVVTKALTSTNVSPNTTIRNHRTRGGRRQTMDHENIRVDVSVKARGIAAAHAIIAQMTADNINTELAKVGLRSASVLVPAVLVTAQSAGPKLADGAACSTSSECSSNDCYEMYCNGMYPSGSQGGGRRLLGNALTTSVTTLHSLRGRGIVTNTATKLSTRLRDRRGRRSGDAPLEDSATCTHDGFTCAEILSNEASGGWDAEMDAETVCSTLTCDSTSELASEACPYTCAKALSETYWTSYGECMSGLAKEEQCLKCPEGTYGFDEARTDSGPNSCRECPDDAPFSPAGSSTYACEMTCGKGQRLSAASCQSVYSSEDFSYSNPSSSGGSCCIDCEAGKFKASNGPMACEACPTNTSSYLAAVACQCNAGFTGLDGGPCTECVAGKYKSSTGSGSCTPCSIGTYSAKIQATALTTCTACPSSATSPEASTTVSDCSCATGHTGPNCTDCQAAKYKPTTGSSACIDCPGNSNSMPGTSFKSSCMCKPGYSGAATSTQGCQSCDAGKYKPRAGAKSCTHCSTGTYSPNTSATAANTCVPCRDFSTSPAASDSAASCNCNAGYTNSIAGAANDACSACVAGKFKRSLGSDACDLCVQGKYGVNTAATSSDSCLSCDFGTTSIGENRNGKASCVCNAGWTFNKLPEAVPPPVCIRCESGTFKNITGSALCIDCPTGKTSPPGSPEFDLCQVGCGAGSTGPDTGPCVLCKPGKYKTIRGFAPGDSETECGESCPDHTTSPVGSDALIDCICNPGYTGENGLECSECVEGKYKINTGDAACELCPNATYSESTAAIDSKTCLACMTDATSHEGSASKGRCMCNAGHYRNVNMECQKCGPGKYKEVVKIANPGSNEARCLTCGVGKHNITFGVISSQYCDDCQKGKYSTEEEKGSKCLLCEAGTYGPLPGAIAKADCIKCDDTGQTSSPAGSSLKSACACPAGSVGPAAGPCQECAVGKTKSTTGDGVCTTCPDKDRSTTYQTGFDSTGSDERIDCKCNQGYFGYLSSDAAVCTICPIGKFKNNSAAHRDLAECQACPDPVGETTIAMGSTDISFCVCADGFERDCKTNICQPCDLTELATPHMAKYPDDAKTCRVCPSGGTCDGSVTLTCDDGFYYADHGEVNPGVPSCQSCPMGAKCENNMLIGEVGHVWQKEIADGSLIELQRLTACPSGYSLVRARFNPQADSCVMCTAQFYNIEGSTFSANGTDTVPGFHCKTCPVVGANCPGGNVVLAKPGWFAFLESERSRRVGYSGARIHRRSENTSEAQVMRVYECPPEACAGSNVCLGNRTGLLCGYCEPNFALELGVCQPCPSGKAGETGSTLLLVFGVTSTLIVLFLSGWRSVFVDNVIHRAYDWMVDKFSDVVQRVLSARDQGNDGNEKKAEAASFMQDPNIKKHLPQAFKIIIAYYQVMTSFINFKLEWPNTLQRVIKSMRNVATIVAFDLMAWPGFGCLVVMPYESKLYLRIVLPGIIGLMMGLPLFVVFVRLWFLNKHQGFKEDKLELKRNLLRTQNVFWNNILTWLFLVYPTTSLASMEAFGCTYIAGEGFLSADLRLPCPIDTWNSMALWSIFSSMLWALGVPFCSYLVMMYHGVPKMARQKQIRGLVNCMVDAYMDDNLTSSAHTLAILLGPSSDHGQDEDEFLRRSDDLYLKIFPEHSHCEGKECQGHQLPVFPRIIMHELDHPKDLLALTEAASKWFDRIDDDLGGTLTLNEIRSEFVRLNQSEEQANFFLNDFDVDNTKSLDAREFENALLHSLETTIPGMTAAQVITLWALFPEFDENLESVVRIQDFEKISKKLTENAFSFTGMETFETLNVKQLVILRSHAWVQRDIEGADDTAGIQSRFGVFLEDTKAGKDEKKNVQVEEKDETEDLAKVLYTPTLQQEEELEEISKFCKDTCTKLDVHTDVNFDDPLQCVHVLAALTVDLAGVLKFSVIEAKSMSDDIEMHQISDAHVQLYEHAHKLTSIEGGTDTYTLMLEVIRKEQQLKNIMSEQIGQIAWKLKEQGVITLPALEWDGQLGPEERVAIVRLGFLLNAYQVSCWYWEMVEMLRKLLLTGVLVVVYKGSPPQLAGSLLTIFLFLVLHIQVNPYLNKGLNEFQRIILISQCEFQTL